MFHLTCLTNYVFIMAFILSLFSDAEMMGAGSPAPAIASSVSVPKQDSASSVCAAGSCAADDLSSEWLHGFKTNPVEERERLSATAGYSVNPCVHCKYRDLCDDDYCAMLIGRIDMPNAPTTRGWRNFGL